jgi:hypothetical protein
MTEFIGVADPVENQLNVPVPGQPDILDDVTLSFGNTLMVRGRAVPMNNDTGFVLSGAAFSEQGIPVVKEWVKSPDGSTYLVESLSFSDLLAQIAPLQLADASSATRFDGIRLHHTREGLPASLKHPMLLAKAPYKRTGVAIDYTTLTGGTSSATFVTNQTYYIPSSYSVGSGLATFQPGCFIKYGSGAYLLLSGSVSFPASGTAPVFTSQDDDLFGAHITSNNLTYTAAQAIWIYYISSSVTIQNVRIRWANRGLQLDANPGKIADIVTSSKFEQSSIGTFVNLPNGSAAFSSVTACGVTTPISLSNGTYSGSMTPNCGDTQFNLTGLQHESTVTINPSNSSQVAIFAAYYPNGGGILKVTSSDGGNTWSSPVLMATGSSGDGLPAANSDPQAAFDATGNLFLAYTTVNNTAIILAKSRDGGSSWPQYTTFASSFADRPVIATGPGGSYASYSVWVLYIDGQANGHLTVAGAPVASDGTVGSFSSYTPGCSTPGGNQLPPVGTGLAVGPTGKVVMAYGSRYEPTTSDRLIYINLDTDGLGPSQPTTGCTAQIQVKMEYFHQILAQPDRRIFRVPVLAWDRDSSSPHYNRKYLAFTDTQTTNTTDQDTDIYVMSSDDDSGVTWSPRLRVNDASTKSQFFPGIAVDQATGLVAVSWYDCRNDSSNQYTEFFAAVATDGFASQPRNFQLNPTASYSHQSNCFSSTVMNYGDFSGLAYYGGYLFPAWCSFANTSDFCGDIHTCKVAW